METDKNTVSSEHYFIVEVKEVSQKLVAIKADSNLDALEKTKKLYNDEMLVLNYNDLKDTNFSIYKCSPEEARDIIDEAIKNEDIYLMKEYFLME